MGEGWQLQGSLRLDRNIPVSEDKNKKGTGGFHFSGVQFLGIKWEMPLSVPPAFQPAGWNLWASSRKLDACHPGSTEGRAVETEPGGCFLWVGSQLCTVDISGLFGLPRAHSQVVTPEIFVDSGDRVTPGESHRGMARMESCAAVKMENLLARRTLVTKMRNLL